MVKKLWNKFKVKLINFLQWIKEDCKDIQTYIILLIVSVVLFFPVWGGLVLGFIFGWTWGYAMAGATFALLVGPVPFWVISIAVTLTIKKLLERRKHRKTLKKCKTRVQADIETCEKSCEGCLKGSYKEADGEERPADNNNTI